MVYRASYKWPLLALFLLPTTVYAQTYFEPCATALSKPAFKSLNSYLNDGGTVNPLNVTSVDKCFRLNDHEFLVLPKPIFGIYHCEFRQGASCVPYEGQPGRRWEVPIVFEEFTDQAAKHFVLLRQDILEHGRFTETYDVLYLVPPVKQTDGLPFTIQPLVSASTNNDTGSLTDDPCGWSKPEAPRIVPKAVDETDALSVGNDPEGSALVTFQMTETDCNTNRITHYSRQFDFKGEKFQELSH